MKIVQFNGGLNNRLSPQLIGQNEATEFTNIDTKSGSLSPLNDKEYTSRKMDRYIFCYKNNWSSTKIKHWYAEYNEFAYRVNGLKVFEYSNNGIVWKPVYLDKPTIESLTTDENNTEEIFTAEAVEDYPLSTSPLQYPDTSRYPLGAIKANGGHKNNHMFNSSTYKYKIVLAAENDAFFFHSAEFDVSAISTCSLYGSYWMTSNQSEWVSNGWIFNISRILGKEGSLGFKSRSGKWFMRMTRNHESDDTCAGTGNEWDGLWDSAGVAISFSVPTQINSVPIKTCRLYRQMKKDDKTYWRLVDKFIRSSNDKENCFIDWLPDDIIWQLKDNTHDKYATKLPPVGGETIGAIFKETKISYTARYIDDDGRVGNIADTNEITAYQYADDASKIGTRVEGLTLYRDSIKVKLKDDRPFNPLAKPTKVELFRQGGILVNYTKVKNYEIKEDNTYLDDVKDADVDGAILAYIQDIALEANTKYITEHNGTLFSAKGTTLVFSNAGTADVWLEFNFISFKSTITGIAKNNIGLVVFSRYETYIVTGTSIDNYAKILISANYGCISHESIAYNGNNVIFMSNEGICILSGSSITNVSINKLPQLAAKEINIPCKAVCVDEVYYLALGKEVLYDKNDIPLETIPRPTNILFTVKADGSITTLSKELKIKLRDVAESDITEITLRKGLEISLNNIQLNEENALIIKDGLDKVIELPSYLIYIDHNGDILVSEWLVDYTSHIEANKILYMDMRFGTPAFGYIDEKLYDMLYVNNKIYMSDTTGFIAELLGSDKPRIMKWKSGQLAEGGLSILKNNKVLYCYSEGDITLKVYLDGVEVNIKKLNEDGYTEVKLPQNMKLAYYIQFEAEGTGVLKEIEYKVEERQNGR
ncbi:hypothetical protein F1L70_07415 [Campylobacter coli]|nr:hypothetical protein [Campylobacter coli]